MKVLGCYWTTIALLTCVQGIYISKYKRLSDVVNKTAFQKGNNKSVCSAVECAVTCSLIRWCIGVGYNKNTSTCISIRNDTLNAEAGFKNKDWDVYLQSLKKGSVNDSTTTNGLAASTAITVSKMPTLFSHFVSPATLFGESANQNAALGTVEGKASAKPGITVDVTTYSSVFNFVDTTMSIPSAHNGLSSPATDPLISTSTTPSSTLISTSTTLSSTLISTSTTLSSTLISTSTTLSSTLISTSTTLSSTLITDSVPSSATPITTNVPSPTTATAAAAATTTTTTTTTTSAAVATRDVAVFTSKGKKYKRLCDDGEIYANGYCHVLFSSKSKWHAAKENCLEIGGNLIKKLNKILQHTLKSFSNFSDSMCLWLGGRRGPGGQRVRARGKCSVTAARWNFKQQLTSCSGACGYICSVRWANKTIRYYDHTECGMYTGTGFRNSCYVYFTDKAKWTDARDRCNKLQMSLVEISNKEENDFIIDYLEHLKATKHQKSLATWTGLSDRKKERRFVWTSGKVITFSYWLPGIPDGKTSVFQFNKVDEDCVEIAGSSLNLMWNDRDCNHKLDYLCERRGVLYI